MSQTLVLENLIIKRNNYPLSKEINFAIEQGNLLHVVGNNGCGKTTLLQTLSGLNDTYEGRYWIASHFYCMSTPFLSEKLTVNNFINLQINKIKSPKKINVYEWGIQPLLNSYSRQLSEGQKKLLSLFLSFLSPSKILLLDEPFAYLDEQNKFLAVNMINNFLKEGGSILITSHEKLPQQLQTNGVYEWPSIS